MRPLRSPSPALFLSALSFSLVAALLSGCGKKEDEASKPPLNPVPPKTAVSVAPAATPAPQASASAAAASAAPAKKRKPPESFEQVSSELTKACTPQPPAQNNMEMKAQFAQANECMKKKMNASLDEVLLPLKKSDPARFKALMKEQATWNQLTEDSCRVEEELAWLDFDDGSRDDGTMRGYAFLGCFDRAFTERTLYARALASGDVSALSKRVDELQKKGTESKSMIADRKKKATQWVMTPPKVAEGKQSGDWKDFWQKAEKVQDRALELAKTTCSGYTQLATALGGDKVCETKLEAYYYAQAIVSPDQER